MNEQSILTVKDRCGFRAWLEEHAATEPECWVCVRRGRPVDPEAYEKGLAHLIEETKKGKMYGAWDDYGRLTGETE